MSDIVPAKRGRPPKTKYTEAQWEQVKELVTEHPEQPLAEISRLVNIPVTTIESRAVRLGWLNSRDLADQELVVDKLQTIIQQISLQISDQNFHLSGMIEALQYSYRIRILRDSDGTVHYRNFLDYPGKPANWNSLSNAEQDALLKYITPARFVRFMEDMFKVFGYKNNLITFVSKVVKGALPKVDPFALDLSKRDTDNPIVDDIPVLELLEASKALEDNTPDE